MKSARIRLLGDLRFRGVSGSGHAVHMDSADGDSGARPAELLLVALAGCTAMDVISILRKMRQEVVDYRVEVSGTRREEHPQVYTEIEVVHVVRGRGVDPAKVAHAVELSSTKYCSASAMLAASAEVRHRYEVEEA
jgi:putative redox protein